MSIPGTCELPHILHNPFHTSHLFAYINSVFSFYLYRSSKIIPGQIALILVPTKQFEHFLMIINSKLGTDLTIPSGGAKGAFQVTFENDDTPRPRYLGRATNRDMAENLKAATPPSYYRLDGESDAISTPTDRSLTSFNAKIDLLTSAQKGKKVVSKDKRKAERIARQQSWNQSIKRTQRYLGIRAASHQRQTAAIEDSLNSSDRGGYHTAFQSDLTEAPSSWIPHPDDLAPYEAEGAVVFVCVDVEAWERDSKKITEIGIATLDTEDLKSVVMGKDGANWLDEIRTRHFRIKEHKHLNNTEFVNGCADRFEFG